MGKVIIPELPLRSLRIGSFCDYGLKRPILFFAKYPFFDRKIERSFEVLGASGPLGPQNRPKRAKMALFGPFWPFLAKMPLFLIRCSKQTP
jgi:hypothetical protein